MSADGQSTKQRRKIAGNFHRLSRVHERYRRHTTEDGGAIAYSAREREFTFDKNYFRIAGSTHFGTGTTAKSEIFGVLAFSPCLG